MIEETQLFTRQSVEKHLRCGLGYMEACLEDK